MLSIHSKPWNERRGGSIRDDFHEVDENMIPLEALFSFICTNVWSPIIWQDGVRLGANMKYADYLGLDFDKNMTLTESYDEFGDFWHIIGTTRNHQKWKGNAPPCDRFRVVLRLERRIIDHDEYDATYAVVAKKYGLDSSCRDKGRLFFPCTEITSSNCHAAYKPRLWPVEVPSKETVIREPFKYKRPPGDDRIRLVSRKIIDSEKIYTVGDPRNATIDQWHPEGRGRDEQCFLVAGDLLHLGYSFEEIERMLLEMIVDDTDFPIEQLRKCINSAIKRSQE